MKEIDSAKENDLEYKVYLEERKLLISAEREGARQFDRAILTLAGGAFGLSLTFIRQIAPQPKSGTILMLIGAWVSFSASLLSTLISFLTSQSACSKQREILEKEYFGSSNDDQEKNMPAIWTRRLNWFSIVAFIFGVLFLASFSFLNLMS